jgi:hypothetical protein
MAVFVFLSYLAAGLVVSLAVVRLGEEGRKFFLFNGALGLVLGALSLALRLVGPGRFGGEQLRVSPLAAGLTALGLALLAAYLVAAAWRDVRPLLRVAATVLALGILADASALHPAAPIRHAINAGLSAWLAGSILLAMILGHFYLVIPGLSIAPLRSLFRFSLAGLALRIALIAVAGALWWSTATPDAFSVATFLNQGVFVLQRVLFGLVIPASLAWFTWKTIEMRSTQSATGILYVVVFLTLVGEALSVYLSLETSVPL